MMETETENDTASLLPELPQLDDFGFFAGNPLMHPAVAVHDIGLHEEPTPYSMATDNLLACVLLGCFVTLAVLYKFLRPFLRERTRALFFFSPSGDSAAADKVETGMEFYARTLTVMLASIMIGCAYNGLMQETGRCYLPHVPFWLPPLCHSACVLAYLILKHQLHRLVCMVFFEKKASDEWRRERSFLTSVETMLFFCACVVAAYGNLTLFGSILVLVSPLIIVKITLFVKAYGILFGKIYRALHFFVYFCTLELVPVLILWMVLNKITGNLTIT